MVLRSDSYSRKLPFLDREIANWHILFRNGGNNAYRIDGNKLGKHKHTLLFKIYISQCTNAMSTSNINAGKTLIPRSGQTPAVMLQCRRKEAKTDEEDMVDRNDIALKLLTILVLQSGGGGGSCKHCQR